jgi:hypothetical protein
VTLRARWVTLRARWVTPRACWVTLRARWVQGNAEFNAELQFKDNAAAARAHVLPVIASCPTPACLVYPYMPNGSLSDRLRRRLGGESPTLVLRALTLPHCLLP